MEDAYEHRITLNVLIMFYIAVVMGYLPLLEDWKR
jgi:hypothetical protein